MLQGKEECDNIADILQQTKNALLNKDSLKLKELSNKTIQSSCFYQDPGAITAAVLIYTLSKLIERSDYKLIKSWDKFIKKFNTILDLAISALFQNEEDKFSTQMIKARKLLESISLNLKPYIEEVIRKAAINKGSKMHEHGISIGQTSKLLGVSYWELVEYTGQSKVQETNLNETIEVKKRAKMALEFFS